MPLELLWDEIAITNAYQLIETFYWDIGFKFTPLSICLAHGMVRNYWGFCLAYLTHSLVGCVYIHTYTYDQKMSQDQLVQPVTIWIAIGRDANYASIYNIKHNNRYLKASSTMHNAGIIWNTYLPENRKLDQYTLEYFSLLTAHSN